MSREPPEPAGPARIAVRVAPGLHLLFDPEEIYYLEAEGHDTILRGRGRKRWRSVASLSEWHGRLEGRGFLRIHRSYIVNLGRVREVRRRRGGSGDWEVKMDPPVNKVLPVSRDAWPALRRSLGLED